MENQAIHILEHRDDTASRLGMWVFIFTEMLLFGGLFIVYAVYRSMYHQQFHEGALELNTIFGAVNTVVLLISSMTVAMSLTAMKLNDIKLSKRLLLLTVGLGILFLVNKYFEWGIKFHHGLYPNSPVLLSLEKGHILYFGLYFCMTGLHALHIIVGLVLLSVVFMRVRSGKIKSDDCVLLENGALYWHLVDLIWIFLFPLLYLIT